MTTIMIDTWGPMLFQNLLFPDDNAAQQKVRSATSVLLELYRAGRLCPGRSS